jgi:plastocyanin
MKVLSIIFSLITIGVLLSPFLSHTIFFKLSFAQEDKQNFMFISYNSMVNTIFESAKEFIFIFPIATDSNNDSSIVHPEINISIGSTSFVPSKIQVPIGSKVIWTNDDSTLHTVTEGNPETDIPAQTLFDSDIIYSDQTWDYTFESIGTFDYHCTIHPFMKGTVIVM